MINRIYNTLKFFSNNQVQGNVTPTEFNVALLNRINERQDMLFTELNRYQVRENKGLISGGLSDLPKKISEKINYYLSYSNRSVSTLSDGVSSSDTGIFTLPDDHRFTDLVINNDNGRPLQDADSISHFTSINLVKHTQPTANFPICIRNGASYNILPATISEVKLLYLRNPIAPNWTYTVVDGVELFNSSDAAFRDVDAHPSEEFPLTIAVLKSFGINLKEDELLKAATSEQMQEFQKQNSI